VRAATPVSGVGGVSPAGADNAACCNDLPAQPTESPPGWHTLGGGPASGVGEDQRRAGLQARAADDREPERYLARASMPALSVSQAPPRGRRDGGRIIHPR